MNFIFWKNFRWQRQQHLGIFFYQMWVTRRAAKINRLFRSASQPLAASIGRLNKIIYIHIHLYVHIYRRLDFWEKNNKRKVQFTLHNWDKPKGNNDRRGNDYVNCNRLNEWSEYCMNIYESLYIQQPIWPGRWRQSACRMQFRWLIQCKAT